MRAEQQEVLKQISACEDLTEFEASGLDLNMVVRIMLDEPGQPRKSSKNVIKAFARAFRATRTTDGIEVSCYAQAVEMLGYVSACASLLEPDQIVRVIELAPQTFKAYSPEGLLQVAEGLAMVLTPYSSPRRERLVKDLWIHAHRNEWWVDRNILPLPDLDLNVEDEIWKIRSIQAEPDRFGLSDAQISEWATGKVREFLTRFEDQPVIARHGKVMNLVAYAACLQSGRVPEVSAHHSDVRSILESPLAGCLDAQTLVRLVEGDSWKIDYLAERSELLGSESYLIPEVAKLVEDSSSVKVLASSLVSPERFQAAYQAARVEVKTALQVSPHLTSQQARDYVNELVQALATQQRTLRRVAIEVLGEYSSKLPGLFHRRIHEFQAMLDGDSSFDGDPWGSEVVEYLGRMPLSHLFYEEMHYLSGGYGRHGVWGHPFGGPRGTFFDHEEPTMEGENCEEFSEQALTRVTQTLWRMDTEFGRRIRGAVDGFNLPEVFHAAKDWKDRPMRAETLEGFLSIFSSREGRHHGEDYLMYELAQKLFGIKGENMAQGHRVNTSDPHVTVALASGHLLSPAKRPVSPAVELVRRALVPVKAGERHLFPETPTRWGQLSDKVNSISFQYPQEVLDLSGTELPDHPGVVLRLVRSTAALKANSEHMGNCTSGYASSARNGRWAVFHFEDGDTEYNASINIDHDRYRVGEINTRFNRGGVTPEVRKAFEGLVAGLNA